jgi:hypothetical protein
VAVQNAQDLKRQQEAAASLSPSAVAAVSVPIAGSFMINRFVFSFYLFCLSIHLFYKNQHYNIFILL